MKNKIEIIEDVLNVNGWSLKKDENTYPGRLFVFDNGGRLIMEKRNYNNYLSCQSKYIWGGIRTIFGFGFLDTKRVVKILVKRRFGWDKVAPNFMETHWDMNGN